MNRYSSAFGVVFVLFLVACFGPSTANGFRTLSPKDYTKAPDNRGGDAFTISRSVDACGVSFPRSTQVHFDNGVDGSGRFTAVVGAETKVQYWVQDRSRRDTHSYLQGATITGNYSPDGCWVDPPVVSQEPGQEPPCKPAGEPASGGHECCSTTIGFNKAAGTHVCCPHGVTGAFC